MKVHYPKLYNMAHLLALNVLLLPKDLTIIFISKESLLWRSTGGKALSRWPEQMVQGHPQSLYEGFRHTNGVVGTHCTGAIKVVKSHYHLSMTKKKM